jgi:hypothetical protein
VCLADEIDGEDEEIAEKKKEKKGVTKEKKTHRRPMHSDLIYYSDVFDLYTLINYRTLP